MRRSVVHLSGQMVSSELIPFAEQYNGQDEVGNVLQEREEEGGGGVPIPVNGQNI